MKRKTDDGVGSPTAVLKAIVDQLALLGSEERGRVLSAAATFFDLPRTPGGAPPLAAPVRTSEGPAMFSQDRSSSPKDFLLDKQPHSDIERVACLAYYLTHYRSTPAFKTVDLSKINTEAAQRKFSNASVAVRNAGNAGLLVPAGKGGMKQLSAAGEQYVLNLPDREAAAAAKNRALPKRRKNRALSRRIVDVDIP